MGRDAVLDVMKRYFEGKEPAELMARFAELPPKSLLKESLDVVDFLVYLEEELGRGIDVTRSSELFALPTFGDLAGEACRLMSEG